MYVPLGLVIWGLMYNSGVHATIAGVAMGLMLRCHTREGERHSRASTSEHLVRPLSAGLAVPLFALFSAGVALSGGALADVFTKPETLGVVLGLVVGKTLGIFGGTWLTARFTRASLSDDLNGLTCSRWRPWPVSGSPSRCSSVSWPSRATVR